MTIPLPRTLYLADRSLIMNLEGYTLETLFAKQPEWGSHYAPRPELILGYMRELGLDMGRLKASLQDSEIESKICQDQEDGNKLGAARTPAFFLNGKML